ncbi:LytR/AlgR family response regulator transcription factor [Pedobacter metabolipauper]|uniref:LytTR family two component transcriptional regulator n=1 Tax=Pedobacter metabolipauper TaxID=425513 RepID=A0A4R6SU10_9SPHI|nr:LytTR family DNA-binding domain-containing protein [Pedobacter metabolipauper]TDQ08456.1 LytTR family two component transcriptional regulator [Pedobacter metabolipauper]
MNNLSCFIMDDEQGAVETLSQLLHNYAPHLTIAGTANSVKQALEFLSGHGVDILFLDIKMKQESGFDLLKQLPENKAHVIFVTAHDEYGIQAIKFSATDYLLKPVMPKDLIAAVHKVGQQKNSQTEQLAMLLQSYQHQRDNTQKRIALPDQHEIKYMLIENIVCCAADNSYTSFYISAESSPIIVSKPISEYEQILSVYGFIRIHQSWLINRNHIDSFKKADGGYLIMDNGMSVPVSRQRKHLLKEL